MQISFVQNVDGGYNSFPWSIHLILIAFWLKRTEYEIHPADKYANANWFGHFDIY